jgi:hypothetical protein
MPPAGFASRHRQLGLVAASAVGIVAVVAVVAFAAHPWRDAATPDRAADTGLAGPASSLPAIRVSAPASPAGSAPASTPAAKPTPTPSSAPSPVSRPASPTAPRVLQDSQPNFKVNVQASPTHVVWGHPVRVTVTVVDAGEEFDRTVVMFVQGSDPSDTVSDATPPCTATYGSFICPINDVQPGHVWSFTFTFIPGTFPGTDGFDDPVAAAFNYPDSHGQQKESPSYYAHVTLFDPPASSPPAPGAPSNPPPPSTLPASAAPTSATSTPSTTG